MYSPVCQLTQASITQKNFRTFARRPNWHILGQARDVLEFVMNDAVAGQSKRLTQTSFIPSSSPSESTSEALKT